MSEERYLMTTDNDSHWYIIPYAKRGEWQKWLDLDQDDPTAWETPDFAEEIGGSPTLVTFTGYKIG